MWSQKAVQQNMQIVEKKYADFSEKLMYFRALLDICLYMFCLPDGLIILSL